MIKIIINGIGGQVGNILSALIKKNEKLQLIGGVDMFAKQENYDIPVFTSFEECDLVADVIIDFSRPTALDGILAYCLKVKANAVLATTGYSVEQQQKIDEASKKIAIFQTSNMSLGVSLLIGLAKDAARFLGNNYDIEILEYHHNLKVDSPSGTALSLANGINEVFENKKEYVYGRHGKDDKRMPKDIGIHAIRGGTIVGKHDVMYIGTNEIVTLSHEAHSRGVFANGAMRAAEFMADKKHGKYDMNDIIGKDFSVTIVSGTDNITLLSLTDISLDKVNKLLSELSVNEINLDMISQTLTSTGTANISFTFDSAKEQIAKKLLEQLKLSYDLKSNSAKLLIEGAGMEHQYGIASEILNLMQGQNITIYAITTSETKIALCVDSANLKKGEELIKTHFSVNI